ncbi:MAG: GNAT family N-acetyltransferase [Betaproteobacteria bacterium]
MDALTPALAQLAQPALEWQWSRLSGLAPGALYAVMALRQQVFVAEQRCTFVDADGFDVDAWHLLGWEQQRGDRALAAYLRVVDPGGKYPEPSIGRVVTPLSHRGIGLGRALMVEGMARSNAAWPGRAIRIAAQQRLEAFYAGLGFRTMAAPYLEDGILHVEMLRAA